MKGPITIDFFEKGASVNSASYCQLLRQNSPYLLNDLHIYKHTHTHTHARAHTHMHTECDKKYIETKSLNFNFKI